MSELKVEYMLTSALVRLVAGGAASAEDQAAAEAELDLRVPAPPFRTIHTMELIGVFASDAERATIVRQLTRRGGRVVETKPAGELLGKPSERLTVEVSDDNLVTLDDTIAYYQGKLHFLSMTAREVR